MAGRTDSVAELAAELVGEERVRSIRWSHPELRSLSETARLIYASLVDACSDDAREILAGVDIVWRNRQRYRRDASSTAARRTKVSAICAAVSELIAAGLLLSLDEDAAVSAGWVRKPWEGRPS